MNKLKIKQSRPSSSMTFRKLANIYEEKSNKNSLPNINYEPGRNIFFKDFSSLSKIDIEQIYQSNLELRKIVKDLNNKIYILKSNNQKLNQTISQKNKQIDELTNEIILKNKELCKKYKNESIKKKTNQSELEYKNYF